MLFHKRFSPPSLENGNRKSRLHFQQAAFSTGILSRFPRFCQFHKNPVDVYGVDSPLNDVVVELQHSGHSEASFFRVHPYISFVLHFNVASSWLYHSEPLSGLFSKGRSAWCCSSGLDAVQSVQMSLDGSVVYPYIASTSYWLRLSLPGSLQCYSLTFRLNSSISDRICGT